MDKTSYVRVGLQIANLVQFGEEIAGQKKERKHNYFI